MGVAPRRPTPATATVALDGTIVAGSLSARDSKLAPLQDPDYFAKVEILHRTVHWPQDDLDLAPELLYETAKANGLIRPLAAAAA